MVPEPLRLDLPREELAFSPGVIPALYQIVEDLVKPDHGKVLTMTPAYGFFLHACEYNGVEWVTSPLRKVEGCLKWTGRTSGGRSPTPTSGC